MEALKENFINKLIPETEHSGTSNIIDFKKNLRKEIEETVNWEEITQKLMSTKQEKVLVHKIVTEHELDFIKSVNQLKRLFKLEVDRVLSEIDTEYNNELFRVKSAFNNLVFGENLMNMIQILSKNKYCLLMKDNKIWAHCYYYPKYPVTKAIRDEGIEIEYEDPVCYLKGIYVNLLHSKITLTTIYLNTESRHPNAQGLGLTTVCPGNLEDREIDLTSPEKLVALLDDICRVYECIHLESSYFEPEGEYSETGERSEAWQS